MTSENFKKWNLILGWGVFVIALITYTLTLEPTVSSWDCGEYISTAVKLEVGHPPGAPLFQMMGAFFAMFTSDVENIAMMVNFLVAILVMRFTPGPPDEVKEIVEYIRIPKGADKPIEH